MNSKNTCFTGKPPIQNNKVVNMNNAFCYSRIDNNTPVSF